MKKILIACLFTPFFAHAVGEMCLDRATNMAQNQLSTAIWYAENYPKPDNQKYLACKGQKVRLASARPMDNGFGYVYIRYDFVADCGGMTIDGFWSEYYNTSEGCRLRGE